MKQMEQEQKIKNKENRPKAVFYIVLFIFCVFLLTAIITGYQLIRKNTDEKDLSHGDKAAYIQQTDIFPPEGEEMPSPSAELTFEAEQAEGIEPVENTGPAETDIDREADVNNPELHSSSEEALSQEPALLKNITVFEGSPAIFQCYEKDAAGYEWEYYSMLDKKWQPVSKKPELINSVETDELFRDVSTLTIPGEKENDQLNIRCTIFREDGEEMRSEACLKIIELKYPIKSISIDPVEAEAGEYLPALSLNVLIDTEQGHQTVSGLQGLTFCINEDEEASKTYDKENSLMTEVYKKVSKESFYIWIEEGEQTVPARFHYEDEAYDTEVLITGSDTRAPEIASVQADYEVSNREVESTPAKISADVTDNYSMPSELTYAFSSKDNNKELQWSSQLPVEANIEQNGTYYFYAKDKAGNISQYEMEIVTVDMKPPVIEELFLEHKPGGTQNTMITVKAADKTALLYRFLSDNGTIVSDWSKENTYPAAANGTYTVEVKDAAGNITKDSIDVKNIDMTAPRIIGIYEKNISAGSQNLSFSIETIPDKTSVPNVSDYQNTDTVSKKELTEDIPSFVSNETTTGPNTLSGASLPSAAAKNVPSNNAALQGNRVSTSAYGTGTGITGNRGAKGEKGDAGAAGTSAYVHIRYSEDSMGTNMSTVPSANTKYIGIYSGTSQYAPASAGSYTWSLYQGENTHVYIRFSASADGRQMTEQPTASTKYIGFCTTPEETAPVSAGDYTWSKYIEDAATVYIRYSAYENGADMTEMPAAESRYIGLCTTQGEAPADPGAYVWSLYKGASSYVYIRFSASAEGTNMTETAMDDSRYMGICSSASPEAPQEASGYSWIKIAGDNGSNSYIHVKYSEDSAGANMSDTPSEESCYMGIYADNSSQAPEDPAVYKWCRISYGNEMADMRSEIVLLQSQIQTMQSRIEELENR